MGGGKKKKNKQKKNDQTKPAQATNININVKKTKLQADKSADVKEGATTASTSLEQVTKFDDVEQSTSVSQQKLDRDSQQNDNWFENDEPPNHEENSETSKKDLGSEIPKTSDSSDDYKGRNKQNQRCDPENKSKGSYENKGKDINEKSSTTRNSDSKLDHPGNSNKGRGRRLQEHANFSHNSGPSANQDSNSRKNYNFETNREKNSSPNRNWRGHGSSPWGDAKNTSKSGNRLDSGSKSSFKSEDSSWENKPSMSQVSRSRRDVSPNKNSQVNSEDKEFRYFYYTYRKQPITYVKVNEIEGDLFQMPTEYALAHCVAEDMNMGSGIAVQFSQQFKRRDELYQQRQRQGGVAILEIDQRTIYYLVTKKLSNGKPTYETLWSSLQKMQKHIEENKVKKLAIPRIGCGLDRLEWSSVKSMLEYIFRDTDVEITVCNFQQLEDDSSSTPLPLSQPKTSKKCIVKNVEIPLVQIDSETAIVYFGSEDCFVTEEIESLNTKFRTVSRDYKSGKWNVGDVVQTWANNNLYALYGCIVKKTKDEPFNFINFQKCINRLRSLNSKDNMFYYVGIEAFLDRSDDLIMNKIVNMLRYSLRDVWIYVCWPGKMKEFMPRDY